MARRSKDEQRLVDEANGKKPRKKHPDEALLTVQEFAEKIGSSAATVWRHIREKRYHAGVVKIVNAGLPSERYGIDYQAYLRFHVHDAQISGGI